MTYKKFWGLLMLGKNLLILTLIVFSNSLLAGEFRQYKNKMLQNLKETSKLNGAIKSMFIERKIKIVNKILKN